MDKVASFDRISWRASGRKKPPGRGSSLMFWGPIRDKPDVISSPSFSGLSSTFKCWSNCS